MFPDGAQSLSHSRGLVLVECNWIPRDVCLVNCQRPMLSLTQCSIGAGKWLPSQGLHFHLGRDTWMGFPGGSVVKSLPANAVDKREVGLISRSGRFPWRRKWQPNAIFLPGNFHGLRSLATVRGVVKSWTQLSYWAHAHTYTHIHSDTWMYMEVMCDTSSSKSLGSRHSFIGSLSLLPVGCRNQTIAHGPNLPGYMFL